MKGEGARKPEICGKQKKSSWTIQLAVYPFCELIRETGEDANTETMYYQTNIVHCFTHKIRK